MATPDQNSDSGWPRFLRSPVRRVIFFGLGAALLFPCLAVLVVVSLPFLLLYLLFVAVVILPVNAVWSLQRRFRGLGPRTIEDPAFGTIRLESDHWCGVEVRLPRFAEYDTVAAREWFEESVVKDHPECRPRDEETEEDRLFRQGTFPLFIAGGSGREPSGAQREAYRYLLENEEKILGAVMEQTFSDYTESIDQWRDDLSVEAADAEYIMPHLDSPDALKRLMRLGAVTIEETAEDGIAEIAFHFSCTWDEEHGWEITTHQDRVVR